MWSILKVYIEFEEKKIITISNTILSWFIRLRFMNYTGGLKHY